jgi:hypothetical protein
MNEEDHVHDLLAGAVPPLAAPADRLGQVAVRVRRSRRRGQFGAVAAVAAVIVATSTAITLSGPVGGHPRPPVAASSPAAPVAVGDCPTSFDQLSAEQDSTETVVRGPTAITLCAVTGPLFDPVESWLRSHEPRTLTTRIDEMVLAFNIRLAGGSCPPLVSGDFLRYAFVVTYAHTSRVIDPDTECRDNPGLIDAFLRLYRAQLADATSPARVPTPTCPATYSLARLDPFHASGLPIDDVGPNRGDDRLANRLYQQLLPSPLAAVAVCGYHGTANRTYALSASKTSRTDLGPVQDLLNASAPSQSNSGGSGSECSGLDPRGRVYAGTDALVVILAADVTGAVVEMRAWRGPACQSTRTALGSIPTVSSQLGQYLQSLGL